MPCGTDSPPPRLVCGGIRGVSASTDIAKFPGTLPPHRPVTFSNTDHGVSHLVQENLVHLVIVGACCQVPRDGNAPLRMVALAETGFRVVKTKAPRRIQVQSNQSVSPHCYPV